MAYRNVTLPPLPDYNKSFCSYNGHILPPLPDYDTAAYPYAFIAQNVTKTAYVLSLTANRPVYGPDPLDSTVNSVYSEGLYYTCLTSSDEASWMLYDPIDGLVHVTKTAGTVIWTNTDILSLVSPIAYNYNGTVLPKLPEWDKETYPYAVIFATEGDVSTASDYWLQFRSSLMRYDVETGKCVMLASGSGLSYTGYDEDTKEWTPAFGSLTPFEYSEGGTTPTGVIWTNSDILNADGSVYLSASDPVPVYE